MTGVWITSKVQLQCCHLPFCLAMLLHGSIWTSQKVPDQPGGQVQKNSLAIWVQEAPFRHDSFDRHQSTKLSHRGPVKPNGHWQRKTASTFSQKPSFRHGLDWQAWIRCWQFVPRYPLGQMHRYESTPSTHVPPWRHELQHQINSKMKNPQTQRKFHCNESQRIEQQVNNTLHK